MGAAGLLALAPHLVLRAIEDGVPLPAVVDLIHLLSEQLAEAADGQARSLSALNSTDAVEAYQLAAAKSGPLGSLGAQLGARIASADPDLLEKYTTYGWHLAVFSQLLNDARDAGPGGPDQKRDVRAGSRTVPLVFAHSAVWRCYSQYSVQWCIAGHSMPHSAGSSCYLAERRGLGSPPSPVR